MQNADLTLEQLKIRLEILTYNHREVYISHNALQNILLPMHPRRVLLAKLENILVLKMKELKNRIDELENIAT